MSPHDRFKSAGLGVRGCGSDLSTEIGISIQCPVANPGQGLRASGQVRSEAADFPRLCSSYKSGLNLTRGTWPWGERKESIPSDASHRRFSNQNDNKNRDGDALLKTPNSVGIRCIDDTERHEFVQAGEKVMASDAKRGARGYYVI